MIRDEDILLVGEPKLSLAERLYLPQILDGMKTTLVHLFKSLFVRPVTVQYPEEQRTLRIENYRGVHRLNRDEQGRVACVACFMCSTACPAHCIHIEAGESPWDDREKYPVRFDLDELRCIYCGMCEEACPVDAIELTHHYDLVGRSREEMILDKEELLAVYDETKDVKPRKNPKITGYPKKGAWTDPAAHGGEGAGE
ncbi:MAG: NADH-quinone oxidoreductase subunit I [Planctomycetota bacterium]|nr:MAG: NADH-quinone oxidoreductase subunit I [Planctomycetota bacterium]